MRVCYLLAIAVLLWTGLLVHASPSNDISHASPHGCEIMAKDLEGMNSLPNTPEVNTARAAKLYAYANRGSQKRISRLVSPTFIRMQASPGQKLRPRRLPGIE